MKNFCASNDSTMNMKTADLKEMLRTELTEESCLEYMEDSELSNRETNKAIKSGQKIQIHILSKKKKKCQWPINTRRAQHH